MLNFAKETARQAGLILLEKYGRAQLEITVKGEKNIVTEADLAAEKYIVEAIKTRFPRHAILAEESGASVTESDYEYRWIIDPLDGTTNFSHAYPCFCVSIGLEYKGELHVGAIYDPTRDEMFAAEKGNGATLNNKRIRVSQIDDLQNALLVTGFPYDVKKRETFVDLFSKFVLNAQGVRRDGSAAIDLAYVACGRFDGFWEDGLNAWDTAAGVLFVREAGGIVTHYDNTPFDIHKPQMLASNGLLHEQMLKVLHS
ncbi:MAG: inositol monophosphatase [Pyrinomonadaceae bacterium]|nr:inositol monophosphatase [Pyrinomonadaceae bacterium]